MITQFSNKPFSRRCTYKSVAAPNKNAYFYELFGGLSSPPLESFNLQVPAAGTQQNLSLVGGANGVVYAYLGLVGSVAASVLGFGSKGRIIPNLRDYPIGAFSYWSKFVALGILS